VGKKRKWALKSLEEFQNVRRPSQRTRRTVRKKEHQTPLILYAVWLGAAQLSRVTPGNYGGGSFNKELKRTRSVISGARGKIQGKI